MMHLKSRSPVLLVLLPFTFFLSSTISLPQAGHAAMTASSSFTFAAAGDIGSLTGSSPGNATLRMLKSAYPDFFLGLGDLSYNRNVTGNLWCQQFKNSYSNIAVMPGEHDTGEAGITDPSTTHNYEQFVSGCSFPGSMGTWHGSTNTTCTEYSPGSCYCSDFLPGQSLYFFPSCYGREYYFDYPTSTNFPLARFVMISPGVYNLTGPSACINHDCSAATGQPCTDGSLIGNGNSTDYGCWQYRYRDAHYNWTSTTIDSARMIGIKWVIVVMFKPCISAGKEDCSIGQALFNLLVADKVDLVLEAHDHIYGRSNQLALNSNAGCAAIQYANSTTTFPGYNAHCVVDDGSRGFYNPGLGTIVSVQGTGGAGLNQIPSNPANAAEQPYFVSLMGNSSAGKGHGFTEFTVTSTKIIVQTHFTGTFQDSYSIVPPPVPSFSWTPPNPQQRENVAFTGSATGANGTYTLTWDFGDGSTASGLEPVHTFDHNGIYNVTLVAKDSRNNTGTITSFIAVGSWNPFVQCSPAQTSIEGLVGNVIIDRVPGDPTTAGADYGGGGFGLAGSLSYGSNPSTSGWPFSKRSLHPPCAVNNDLTLVEIHNVEVRSVSVGDCSTRYDVSNGGTAYPNGQDCSTLFNVANPAYPNCPSCYLHRLYAVIDRDWVAYGVAPAAPNQNQTIDLQGFVYWNPQWINMSWHSYSGWEVHVVAWRLSSASTSQTFNPLWYVAVAAVITTVVGLQGFRRLKKKPNALSGQQAEGPRAQFPYPMV